MLAYESWGIPHLIHDQGHVICSVSYIGKFNLRSFYWIFSDSSIYKGNVGTLYLCVTYRSTGWYQVSCNLICFLTYEKDDHHRTMFDATVVADSQVRTTKTCLMCNK